MKHLLFCAAALLLFALNSQVKADCVTGNVTILNITPATVSNNEPAIIALLENTIFTNTGVMVQITITNVQQIPGGIIATLEIGSATTTLTPAEAAQIVGALNNPLTPFVLTNFLQTSGIPGMNVAVVTAITGQILTGACPSQQAVPTLSAWALIGLGLIMLNFAAITLFRRQRSAVVQA